MRLGLNVKVDGTAGAGVLQRIRKGLEKRGDLNQRIAGDAEGLTRAYLERISRTRHATAQRLGARPTGHLAKAARRVESTADDQEAAVLIPADTGLRRAFVGFDNIVPRNGSKYLTIPAHPLTYGRRAGEFPDDSLDFAMFGGRHRALIFAKGPNKGKVAYWLKKKVSIPQDRSLLPSDDAYLKLAARSAVAYIEQLEKGGPA
ncbi:MAG: hypothetical protein AAGI48_03810 [Verrucomicrobiota bacterium]